MSVILSFLIVGVIGISFIDISIINLVSIADTPISMRYLEIIISNISNSVSNVSISTPISLNLSSIVN